MKPEELGLWQYPISIAIAAVIYLANDRLKRQAEARRMRQGVRTEVEETRKLILDFRRDAGPLDKDAKALRDAVNAERVDFATLDQIPAGWNFFVWSFPLSESLARLNKDQGRCLLLYADQWAQVSAYQAQLRESYLKLVDLTPHLGEPSHRLQLRETAEQVLNSASDLLGAVARLEERATNLGKSVEPWQEKLRSCWHAARAVLHFASPSQRG